MHRLFIIVELMQEIADYLDTPEWASLISVSRSWNLVVVPLLWRRVDFGLFGAFGALTLDGESGYYTVSPVYSLSSSFIVTIIHYFLSCSLLALFFVCSPCLRLMAFLFYLFS